MTQESHGLTVVSDLFSGLTIDTIDQKFNIEEHLEQRLADAIPKWKVEGIRGLWMKIHLSHSSAVPVCSKLGFDFNHAQSGYVMMTKWLPDEEENKLPEYANHFVGEELETTARREVLEETGINSKFVSVLGFRHQHNFRFGCSDWYFVCLMKALTNEIKHCPQEIAECKWISLEEYLAYPDLTDANRFFVQCFLNLQKNGNLTISPTLVDSWNKKFTNNIYNIQPIPKEFLQCPDQ